MQREISSSSDNCRMRRSGVSGTSCYHHFQFEWFFINSYILHVLDGWLHAILLMQDVLLCNFLGTSLKTNEELFMDT